MRNIMELVEEINYIPRTEMVALGTGTAITMAVWRPDDGSIHIAIELKGYYSFAHYANSGYVMEKLFNGKWAPDAEVVASFINEVLRTS